MRKKIFASTFSKFRDSYTENECEQNCMSSAYEKQKSLIYQFVTWVIFGIKFPVSHYYVLASYTFFETAKNMSKESVSQLIFEHRHAN